MRRFTSVVVMAVFFVLSAQTALAFSSDSAACRFGAFLLRPFGLCPMVVESVARPEPEVVEVVKYVTPEVAGVQTNAATTSVTYATTTVNQFFSYTTTNGITVRDVNNRIASIPLSEMLGIMSGTISLIGVVGEEDGVDANANKTFLRLQTGKIYDHVGDMLDERFEDPTFTGATLSGNTTFSGSLIDGLSSAGGSGYVLQSTGSGITWVATSTLGITGTLSGSTTVLSDLTDVNTTGASTGNVLVFNGTTWVDQATSTLGLGGGGSGTVTSVAATVPTGWAIGGTPITGAGTLAFSYDTGYGAVLTASTTEWATAYGWGDHAGAGYLTSVDVSDNTNLTVGAVGIELSGDDIALSTGYVIPLSASTTEWATAYGWGDHSGAGYLTDITGQTLGSLLDVDTTNVSNGSLLLYSGGSWATTSTSSLGISTHDPVTLAGSRDYLTISGQTITRGVIDISDDTNLGSSATGLGITGDNIVLVTGYSIPRTASTTEWATAYGWGDHSGAGYLTDITGQTLGSLSDVNTTNVSIGNLLQYTASGWATTSTSSLGLSSQTLTLGTDNQIPFVNGSNNDFEYSANLTYDGTNLSVGASNGFAQGGTRVFYTATGDDNIYIGENAGNTYSGFSNTVIGEDAWQNHDSGDYNVVIGAYAGQNLATSSDSILIGGGAGAGNGSDYQASGLTIIGTDAGYDLQTGANNNTFYGYHAGINVNTGANNILIGYQAADSLTTGANNIIIGYDVEAPSNTTDEQLNIGNLIFGTGVDGTGTTISSGNIGIGTSSPARKLSVAGDSIFTGALYDNNNSAGSNGMVLMSTGGGFAWTATTSSALGLPIGHDEVTLAGTRDYLTISGQTITRGIIDISDDTNLGSSATGLGITGDNIVLVTGYSINRTASSTNWNTFYDTPSSRITAGDALSWTSNTINLDINGLTDRTAFAAGDKLVIYEDGVGIRKIDYSDLPGAGGGLTSLNGQTGSTQTFATSSDTNITLSIVSAGDSHTFTPGWTGTLAGARGGTGLSTVTQNELLIGGAGNTWTQVATSSLNINTDDLVEGSNQFFTNALARAAISETITGLTYTSGTGVFSLDGSYTIPLSASTTEWNVFYNTPSNRITAGTGLSWSTNTLNVGGLTTSEITDGTLTEADFNLNAPTDGYILVASSTAAGGFAWYATSSTYLNLASGGGSSVSFGTDNQIPVMNAAGTDFEYTSNFTFTGSNLTIGSNATQAGLTLNGVTLATGSTTNSNWFFAGASSPSLTTSAANNVLFGVGAGEYLTTATSSFAVGRNALQGSSTANYTGQDNVALGINALRNVADGSYNFAAGRFALENTNGYHNIAIGRDALQNQLTGSGNIALGWEVFEDNIESFRNIGIGLTTARNITDGDYNVLIGSESAINGTSVAHSVSLGALSLQNNNGTGTIAIGYGVADNATAVDRGIIIGYDVEFPSNTDDYQLNIGNLIYGTNVDGTGTTLSTGNIGIGTSSPASKLDVWGDLRVGTSGTPLLFADVSAGLIGIGNSNPQYTLDITGNIRASGNFRTSQFIDSDDTDYFVNPSSGSVAATLNGNVGIGTSTPAYLLTVGDSNLRMYFNNSVQEDNDKYGLGFNASGANTSRRFTLSSEEGSNRQVLQFGDTATGNETMFGLGRSTDSGATWSPHFVVQADGDIGIGTSSPNAKLTVAGDINVIDTASNLGGTFLNGSPLATGSSTINNWYFAGATSTGFSSGAINNLMFGEGAGTYLSTGDNNFGVGSKALRGSSTANITGNNNIAFGLEALRDVAAGSNNIAMGRYTLQYSDGFHNIALGRDVLWNQRTGSVNIGIGFGAMADLVSGDDNVAIGQRAMANFTRSKESVFIGNKSAEGGAGDYGVGVGAYALNNNNGTGTIAIGWRAGDSATAVDGGIIIGYNVDFPSATTDNQLNIGNLIFGTDVDGSGTTLSSGNVGIGTSSPSAKLTVASPVDTNGSALVVRASTSQANYAMTIRNDGNSGEFLSFENRLGNMIFGISQLSAGGLYLQGFDATGATQFFELADSRGFYDGGNFGIGTTTPATTLDVKGTIRFEDLGSASANLITDALGNVTVSSDERLKDINSSFDKGLAELTDLEPILYNWNVVSGYDTENEYAGFSAQNVQEAIPEAVREGQNGYLTLADRPIIAALVNAAKEQQLQLAQLLLSGTTTVHNDIIDPSLVEEDSIWRRIVKLAQGFTDGVLNLVGIETEVVYTKEMYAEEVNTDKLCIGNTCVTERQLIDLLEGGSSSSNTSKSSSNTSSSGGSSSPDPQDEEPEPEPEPEVTPDETDVTEDSAEEVVDEAPTDDSEVVDGEEVVNDEPVTEEGVEEEPAQETVEEEVIDEPEPAIEEEPEPVGEEEVIEETEPEVVEEPEPVLE